MVAALFGILVLGVGCDNHEKFRNQNAINSLLSPPLAQSTTSMPNADVAEIKGRVVVNDNFASLGVKPINGTLFETTPYSAYIAGTLDKSQPDTSPEIATMVWLSRKLQPVPCVIEKMNEMCGTKQIVEAIKIPDINIQGKVIVLPKNFSCMWNGAPVLALMTTPTVNAPQSVFAAWQFDLAHEKIISAPPSEVACQDYFNEEARWARSRQFWHGWDFDTESGIEGLHRLGKVIKEEDRVTLDAYGQAEAKIHDIRYDGMVISVTMLPGSDRGSKRMQIVDLVITSPAWPVKYGLMVGSTREKVENTLGHFLYRGDNYLGYSSQEIELPDASETRTGVRFELDKDGKVTEINWHMDDTNGKD